MDAAFANVDDGKSTSGYVFLSAGGAISWKSKKQLVIVLLSTKAEYVALAKTRQEITWLRNLYNELGFPQEGSINLRGDNERLIALAKNPQFHARTKHIAIRYH